jgi:Phage integrase, N-terminal SAM-like domain
MAVPRRRVNGDGSLTRRADGRWMGRYYAWTSSGTRKRVTVYGKTRQQAAERMREAQERNDRGIPVPDRSWKLADWLDHWLEHVVLPNRRPATYRLYEMTVRLYLKPGLGPIPLTRLSASRVQAFFNGHLGAGRSVRTGAGDANSLVVGPEPGYAGRADLPQCCPPGRAACLGAAAHHSMVRR